MEFKREMLLLYAVTDRRWVGRQTLEEQVEDALQGGVTMVQLREKELAETEFLQEAVRIRKLCHRYGVPLIINDHVSVARESGADGIHVGIWDTPVKELRRMYGKDWIIGATAKTVEQARAAQREGADYLGVGAVFPSPTKGNALRITRSSLREICEAVAIPVAAIGGIDADNVEKLKDCKMDGIAVVSAVFAKEHIREAARELKTKVESLVGRKEA